MLPDSKGLSHVRAHVRDDTRKADGTYTSVQQTERMHVQQITTKCLPKDILLEEYKSSNEQRVSQLKERRETERQTTTPAHIPSVVYRYVKSSILRYNSGDAIPPASCTVARLTNSPSGSIQQAPCPRNSTRHPQDKAKLTYRTYSKYNQCPRPNHFYPAARARRYLTLGPNTLRTAISRTCRQRLRSGPFSYPSHVPNHRVDN
jgi:hypothetical protein